MQPHELDKILSQMSWRELPLRYARDEYALVLLSYALSEPRRVRELRTSRYGRLLKRAPVRDALARASDGWLSHGHLLAAAAAGDQPYVLSLGSWGTTEDDDREHYQTTRNGVNLVLHVNFGASHDRQYRELIDPAGVLPFSMAGHPMNAGRCTLAWARIDLDLESKDALIEEIQSDWVRYALEALVQASEDDGEDTLEYGEAEINPDRLGRYVREVLAPHVAVWAEVTLCAAIWLLREELGVRRIFFHTHEGGMRLKSCDPPRALYADLPRRFCFRKTAVAPSFLHRDDNAELADSLGPDAQKPVEWFLLELN